MNKSIKLIYIILNIFVMSVVSCGKGQNKNESQDPVVLAQADLQSLASFNEAGPRTYDQVSNGRFSQIFGGYSGQNVKNFIDERIKYLVRPQDILDIRSLDPSKPMHKGWTLMPLPSPSPDTPRPGEPQQPEKPKATVVAVNLGTDLWLQGLIDQTTYQITLKSGEKVEISSPRKGVILFGPGYIETIEISGGTVITLPQEARQASQIHEAVHSDCPKGISVEDIKKARKAKSYAEFFEGLENKKCGHTHTLCRNGIFRGLPACDAETWGSYVIEAIFLDAVLGNFQSGTLEWQMLNAVLIDSKSRLEYNYDEMIHSQTDHPDLTSAGLR